MSNLSRLECILQSTVGGKTHGVGVMVAARVRPLSAKERSAGGADLSYTDDGKGILFSHEDKDHGFAFHRVFRATAPQVSVFETLGAPLVESVLSGENAAAIAYGMTGSGKTYSMLGPPIPGTNRSDYKGAERGLAPRMLELLFAAIRQLVKGFRVEVRVSFLELYLDSTYDLLHPKAGTKVKVRAMDDGIWIPATEIPCASAAEAMHQFDRGIRGRTTAETMANATSSRSHAIMRVMIKTTNRTTHEIQESVLNLVDLAGSEQVSMTGATGTRLNEAKSINSSLLVLSEVCKRMALPARLRGAVPFRSSTLTTILRNSFGGSSRTAVLVNLSPAIIHARDILTTLRFGANVAAIRNQPKISKRIDFSELRRILDSLNMDVAAQELQLNQFRSMLKRLARAAANAIASRGVTPKRLLSLTATFPVLADLMPGAVMTRFLPKGIILRMLTFAGGVSSTNMISTGKSMKTVVTDERLWKVFCKSEIPGFEDSHLSMSRTRLLKGSNILLIRAIEKHISRLESEAAPAGIIMAAKNAKLQLGPDHGREDPWSEPPTVGNAAAAGPGAEDDGGDADEEEEKEEAAPAAAAGGAATAKPRSSAARRTYRQHYVLVTEPQLAALTKLQRAGFDEKLSAFRGAGGGVRLVRKTVQV